MRIIRERRRVAEENRGASIALGNFDGVHLGHRTVIEHARTRGEEIGAPLGVITFEPHPREFFGRADEPFRLMSVDAKIHRLEKLGVDLLYILEFNKDLSSMTAEAFAAEVLAEAYGVRHVAVGADFCFGKGRQGDVPTLEALGRKLGFTAEGVPLIGEDGPISSTAIRTALQDGRPGDAAKMLGHWHRIDGRVLEGDRRGRELGYPTANLSLGGAVSPAFGVYAVFVDVLTGPLAGSYHGVASIGVRPTFGENAPNFEVHIFDFDGDIYTQDISVGLVERLRPELRFEDEAALIAQMDADSTAARAALDAASAG